MGWIAWPQLTVRILDASVAVAWYVPDQANARTASLLRGAPIDWRAPFCFTFEVSNVLLKYERRKEVRQRAAEFIISELREKVRLEPLASYEALERAISLARRHRISVFDGLYLDLALTLGAELVTRDGPLVLAATHENCAVYDARVTP